MHKIGIISDTHGMLRPEIAEAFAGVELIIHAGDIGSSLVMLELKKIAPVTAVYGNTDKALWTRELPASDVVTVGDSYLYVLHNLAELDIDPAAAGFAAVIYGHSHRQAQETRGGVLYFNPGSAGPRRYSLPASVGLITIENSNVRGEIIPLPEPEPVRY
jgi:putative phosphoesterase